MSCGGQIPISDSVAAYLAGGIWSCEGLGVRDSFGVYLRDGIPGSWAGSTGKAVLDTMRIDRIGTF